MRGMLRRRSGSGRELASRQRVRRRLYFRFPKVQLSFGVDSTNVGSVLNAGIKRFFDEADHEWLIRFVEHTTCFFNLHDHSLSFFKSRTRGSDSGVRTRDPGPLLDGSGTRRPRVLPCSPVRMGARCLAEGLQAAGLRHRVRVQEEEQRRRGC